MNLPLLTVTLIQLTASLSFSRIKSRVFEHLPHPHHYTMCRPEITPKSFDEALCIALRLEAWAKSVKRYRQEDDRIDLPRQKARATAKPEPVKAIYKPESIDRMTKIEADVVDYVRRLKSS